MADFYVKVGGTRAAGASTADDWTTNSNCYSSVQGALNALIANGDRIVLNDETFTQGGIQTATSTMPTGGVIHIVSRSGNPANCIYESNSATTSIIRLNENTDVYTHLFQNIKFTKSVTHTTAGPSVLNHAGSQAGRVEFRGCVFDGITSEYTANSQNSFFYCGPNVQGPAVFDTCQFTDFSHTSDQDGTWFARALAQGMEFIDCTFDGLTNSNSNAAAVVTGGIFCETGAYLTFTNVTVRNITSTHLGEVNVHGPFITTLGPITATRLVAEDFAFSGAQAGAAVIRAEGQYTITDGVCRRIVCTPSVDPAVVGGTFLAYGEDADGVIDGWDAFDCISNFGPAAYWSQGGGGVARNIRAIRCTARVGGQIYSGGWGNLLLEDFVVLGGKVGEVAIGGGDLQGGGLYVQTHGESDTHDKNVTLRRGIVRGVFKVDSRAAGVLIRGRSSTYALNVTIDDVTCDNDSAITQVELEAEAGNILNLIASGLDVLGGAEAVADNNAGPGVINTGTVGYPSSAVTRGVSRGNGVMRRAA